MAHGFKHCECDTPDPFPDEELTADLTAELLLEWGYVPPPTPPIGACRACRLPLELEEE